MQNPVVNPRSVRARSCALKGDVTGEQRVEHDAPFHAPAHVLPASGFNDAKEMTIRTRVQRGGARASVGKSIGKGASMTGREGTYVAGEDAARAAATSAARKTAACRMLQLVNEGVCAAPLPLALPTYPNALACLPSPLLVHIRLQLLGGPAGGEGEHVVGQGGPGRGGCGCRCGCAGVAVGGEGCGLGEAVRRGRRRRVLVLQRLALEEADRVEEPVDQPRR